VQCERRGLLINNGAKNIYILVVGELESEVRAPAPGRPVEQAKVCRVGNQVSGPDLISPDRHSPIVSGSP
jgi:hypothetical protein